jgi:hypothetical protein
VGGWGFQKNHALAESLLSRVFSWDVVDVGFPTCLIQSQIVLARAYLGLQADVFLPGLW